MSLADRMRMFGGGDASGGKSAAEEQQDLEMALKNYERRVKAITWVDKEIRKLIAVLVKHNKKITFGVLFKITMDDFEAISGTLVAAKKRSVVDFEGQLLMQGSHDSVVITLLKETIEDSAIPDKEEFLKAAKAPVRPGGGGGFKAVDMSDNKCATCTKTVYPNERLGAIGKVRRGNQEEKYVRVGCNSVMASS